MNRKLILIPLAAYAFSLSAQSQEEAGMYLNKPFGWACCTSLSEGDSYPMLGGKAVVSPSSITLTASLPDMYTALLDAISQHQIIILDGQQGDFILSKRIELKGLSDKTIVGINGARIRSQFQVTPELRTMLDAKGVKQAATIGGGGTLSNGIHVGEERELLTRQAIIDYTGDETEDYRQQGIFSISHCSNLVLRNLKLQGPGSIDVGGSDVITCQGATTHLWVDHCEISDGMDGNFDINSQSDFITCSWCTFSYSDKAYDHMNTNLVGAGDRHTKDEDHLNVTYAYCLWGNRCNARMPMARFGTIHLLNNYYNCPGNTSNCVNPRMQSEFLIEGNYFAEGVTNIFGQTSAKRWTWAETNLTAEPFSPSSAGEIVSVPYQYSVIDAAKVSEVVASHAGATLDNPLDY